MSSSLLVMLAKFPRKGQVKTRLAATIGDESATNLYVSFIERLVQEHRDREMYDFLVAVADPADIEPFGKLFTLSSSGVISQVAGDLGERMNHLIRDHLSRYERVILIGADLPDLTTDDVQTAITELYAHEVVLGPSSDGGYYLIGATKAIPELFTNISWSTETVLRDTLAKAHANRLTISLLKTRRDIDNEADLRWFEDHGTYV